MPFDAVLGAVEGWLDGGLAAVGTNAGALCDFQLRRERERE